MVRNRTKGNFLFKVYCSADKAKQMLFKSKLYEATNDLTLWNKFNRFQSVEGKEDGFDAEIVGIMVQVFASEQVRKAHYMTDLEKLVFVYESNDLHILELENSL